MRVGWADGESATTKWIANLLILLFLFEGSKRWCMVGWIYNNSNKMDCKLYLLFFLFYCSKGLELGGGVEGMGGPVGGWIYKRNNKVLESSARCTRGLLNLLNLVHIHTYHIDLWIPLGFKFFRGHKAEVDDDSERTSGNGCASMVTKCTFQYGPCQWPKCE